MSKFDILKMIEEKSSVFKQVNDIQYRTRCPICGDSQKDYKATHLYIRCSHDESEPILYNCFKCQSKGILGKDFLMKMDIHIDMTKYQYVIKKTISKGSKVINHNTLVTSMESPMVKYIIKRLGPGLSIQDFNKLKIIENMDDLKEKISNNALRNIIPHCTSAVSFVSSDGSHLISRLYHLSENGWIINTLFNTNSPTVYTIDATIDLFSEDPINIHIAEGILDVISAYKNFKYGNDIYIASLSSDYMRAIKYSISKGLIGKNINLHVYIDWDINRGKLIKQLRNIKWLFGNLNIITNKLYKDIGCHLKNIELDVRRI